VRRRSILFASALAPLAGCKPAAERRWSGGWVGADAALGHRLRDLDVRSLPAPAFERRADVVVVGAGIAGLGAARSLLAAGIDDVQVFDLEASAGGNSRGHAIAGIARYIANPDHATAEFAIVVADEWQGRGVASQLMQALIACAQRKGVRSLHGVALRSNQNMLHFVQRLGFVVQEDADDPEQVNVSLDLVPPTSKETR